MPGLTGNMGGRHLRLAEASDTESGVLCIKMLGDFRVSVGPYTIENHDWNLRKAAHLVKLLALHPGHRMHREQALDLLWPGLSPKKAANNLHRTLHEARKTLATEDELSRHLQLREGQLHICPDQIPWVDVAAFEDAARVARNTREPVAYRQALDLYGGKLLPDDRYEEWTEGRRRELATLRLDLLIELANLYEERDEYRMSIEALEKVVSDEPTHEEAHVSLMRLYALSGRRKRALEQYERLSVVLSRELEIRPDAESKRLFEQIRAGDFTPSESPPVRPLPSETVHPNNLPAPRTSFIGRDWEILEVRDLLEANQFLTLTGVGGAGKTRLALETTRELLDHYPDGAWMVGLSSIAEPDLVVRTVARSFGVREQPHRPIEETLTMALRDKNLLLVLDNCEHVVGAAAKLAEALLDECPRLKILATSRELLGIEGEVGWTVPPLSLPAPDNEFLLEILWESESVRLFADRASQRLTSFSLTQENAGSVAEVCRKLDGIPLAIELAASRVGVLSVEQISERLEDALRLLSGGRRTAEPRQRTLQGVLDWSHDLLDEEERKILRRLSVFAGGFTLEAAEKVTLLGDIPEDNILDLLSGLIDKSLVVHRDVRHRLLEPVRQYSVRKLEESGEYEQVRRWHAHWCVELAGEAEQELMGPDQAWWVNRLEAEHDNLRAALGWTLESGEAELGLRLAGHLWLFWYTRGHINEGRRWLDRSLSQTDNRDPHLRAKALGSAGWLAIAQSDYGVAESLLTEGAVLYKNVGDVEGAGACLSNILFGAVLAEREIEDYRWCMDEIDAIKPQLTHSRTLATIMLSYGIGEVVEGNQERARSTCEDARDLYREAGDAQGAAMSLFTLAFEAIVRDDFAESKERIREDLRISRQQDDKLAIMYGLWMLGCGMSGEGLHARAARLWGASETLQEERSTPIAPVFTNLTGYEGRTAHAQAKLGTEFLKTEWRRGRAMTQEEAIDYALSEETSDKRALTHREKEVAKLIAQGLTNFQISSQLVISERTVHNHVQNIFKKLGVNSRAKVAQQIE